MRRLAPARNSVGHPRTSIALKWVGMLALLIGAAGPLRAQQISVTPQTVPLDGKVTVTASGLFPGALISVFWDRPPQSQTDLPNTFFTPPGADANGFVTFTIDNFPAHFYPATAGEHTLSFLYPAFDFNYRLTNVSITLTARQGWNPSPPLSTTATPQMAGGTLAFLRFSADNLSTSLVATDGQGEKVMGTAAVNSFNFGQPEWSPDGSKIAFSALFDTFPHRNAYVLDVASGALNQVTPYGGTPPRPAGGGTGSISGSIKPYIYPEPTRPSDDGTKCTPSELLQPKGAYVSLVGANIMRGFPITPGAKDTDPIPFQIDNVPAGDYSLNMWHYASMCQEETYANPLANQPGQKPTLVRHSQQTGTPNLSVPVTVTAGQAVQLQALQVSDLYTHAVSPSWLSGASLVYTFDSGSYALRGGGTGLSDIYTVTPGQAPVKKSDSLANGLIHMTAGSPAKGLFAGVSNSTTGLFFAAPATFPATMNVMTSRQVVLFATNNSILDFYPSWDPTGHYVAFVRQFINDNLNVGDLWIHEVSTGTEGRWTQFNLKGGEGTIGRPAWSPDGSQIAVTYTADGLKTRNIRVYNVKDASFFAVTSDGRSGYPAWRAAPIGGIPAAPAFNGPRLPDFNAPGGTPGDVDADGKVAVTDAVLTLKFAVNLQAPTDAQRQAADYNKDNQVNVLDATLILRKIVGLP